MSNTIGQKPRSLPTPPAVSTSSTSGSSGAVATTTNKPKLQGPHLPKLSSDAMGQMVKNQFGHAGQAAMKAGSVINKLKAGLEHPLTKGGLGGLGAAGAGLGIGTGINDIVKGAKEGDANTIAGGALGAASASLGATAAGIESGVFGKIGQGFKSLFGGADKAGAAAAKGAEAAKAAGTAVKVGETALKTGAEVAGKGAARFVPGLNIGIAALDTANAARTFADKNASVGSKITAGITAAGSIAAATNIPIVSQVGAGISALSGIAGGILGLLGK